MVWGAVIAAGASLAGSALSSRNSEKDRDSQASMHGENLAMQRQFAQEGIRWRVADAKAAGIHPLYALGAQLPSYSPSTYIPGGDSGAGAHLAQAGQDIGRAVDATRTSPERSNARLEALALTRGELENELLRAQIAKLYQTPSPSMPSSGSQLIPGQADIERNGLVVTPSRQHVVEKPQEVTRSSPFNASQEPHPINDVGFVRTPTGLAPVPSKDVKERIEDQAIPEIMWSLRNNLIPSLGEQSNAPPKSMLPDGAYSWRWEVTRQEWQPVFHRPRSKPSYDDFFPKGSDERTWSGRPYLGRSRVGSYW